MSYLAVSGKSGSHLRTCEFTCMERIHGTLYRMARHAPALPASSLRLGGMHGMFGP